MAEHDFVTTGHDGLDVGGIATVDDILFGQQVRGGDTHGTQLVESDNREPELKAAFEYEHHHVAVADAQRLEIGGSLVALAFDVGKGEVDALAPVVGPEQSLFVGLDVGPFVYDIIPEIEVFGYLYLEILHEIFLRGERGLIQKTF